MRALTSIDGIPITNAKRPLKLVVTKADIAGADTKEPSHCAVARACKRSLKVLEARVHLSRVYLKTSPKMWVRYLTPKSMRDEIIAFDRGGTFEPTEFRLQGVTPKKQNRRGEKVKRKPNRNGTMPRRKPHVVSNVRGEPVS